MALGGRVGVGNIAGVATAIFYGGPGALFWMWVYALLGAASAFAESTAGQIWKTEDMPTSPICCAKSSAHWNFPKMSAPTLNRATTSLAAALST